MPKPRPWLLALALVALLPPRALPAEAAAGASLELEINEGRPIVSQGVEVLVAGATTAPYASAVSATLEGQPACTGRVERGGRFALRCPWALAEGSYSLEVVVQGPAGGEVRARQELWVTAKGRLPRRPLVAPPEGYQEPAQLENGDFLEMPDRWRIAPPPYEINARPSRFDPYNQNVLKGDYPIAGQDLFLVVTATADTLVDAFTLPTPSGASADRPGSLSFFGRDGQLLAAENVFFSADLFKGDTAFKPFVWRVKATLAGNLNYLATHENGLVEPDVREGTTRTDGRGSLQEAFVEAKLADLSPNYDFLSLRAGIQPFTSDFRGFVFSDTNLGVRLFGNSQSNRNQYNLAFFERLEKDTNSGLNTFELRDQQVAVANFYRQDFLRPGFTSLWSLHYLRDEASFRFDRNGFLARPDPLGSFTPHEVKATYLGWATFGHLGRLNVDSALYYAHGEDDLNPLAGRKVDIRAGMAALELSVDRDWWRPKLAFLYASGDAHPTDDKAEGFAAIFDNPQFAGGGFSFWNRLGLRLPATGVSLVSRGSLLPTIQSSKEEGQPNFVNPGLELLSLGLDAELTPKLKLVATANYLRFAETAPLELALFQAGIHREIGLDLSLGCRWRPLLNQNLVVVGGVAALLPGQGFTDLYEEDSALYAGFASLTLTF
ncbi:MAG TPA: hypothetical protein PK413_05590 [Thermoanaerobaculia bacterium]|nr:hypothetical protein [Thermoanaerobaculia bacterium]